MIDTALDGSDAEGLARYYLEYLKGHPIKFVGIYCPLEERLKRLKTRTDNLFLTEELVKLQTQQWDVFELCKKFYDIWFDSSKLDDIEIASQLLKE